MSLFLELSRITSFLGQPEYENISLQGSLLRTRISLSNLRTLVKTIDAKKAHWPNTQGVANEAFSEEIMSNSRCPFPYLPLPTPLPPPTASITIKNILETTPPTNLPTNVVIIMNNSMNMRSLFHDILGLAMF